MQNTSLIVSISAVRKVLAEELKYYNYRNSYKIAINKIFELDKLSLAYI